MADPVPISSFPQNYFAEQLFGQFFTLGTASGITAAPTSETTFMGYRYISVSSSAEWIRQVIGSQASGGVSAFTAIADSLMVFFIPGFKANGYIYEPIYRPSSMAFDDYIISLSHTQYLLAGNATFFHTSASYTDIMSGPVSDSVVTDVGRSYLGGKKQRGGGASGYSHIEWDAATGFDFDKGDPSISGSENAIGGMYPVIIKGVKSTSANYGNMNKAAVGKHLFGYHDAWDMAVVVVVLDGQVSNGTLTSPLNSVPTLDTIRDFLFDLGVMNCIAYDGSSSVCLYVFPTKKLYRATIEFRQVKRNIMVTGYAIRIP